MPTKTFTTTIFRNGGTCFAPLTFDPKTVFGKVRVPIKVTLNGYIYRSTIFAMGGPPFVALRKSHRDAAGLEGTETLEVQIALDADARVIKPPADFVRALKARAPAWDRWRELSYSHQREHVDSIESAKAPATRARRLARAVEAIALRPQRARK